MECPLASRALVVTARALEEESKELGYNRYLEAVGKYCGRRSAAHWRRFSRHPFLYKYPVVSDTTV